MNKNQTHHLNTILEDTGRELTEKYVKGASEHKSELNKDYSLLQLVEMAFEEALDQVTYLHTLREKLRNEK